jgi:(2R)-ethylmalonyl-CoA mutase
MTLIPRITELLREHGATEVPLVVGGIIPDADRKALQDEGVARIYTPGEAPLTAIIADLVELIAAAQSRTAGAA